MSDLFEQIEQDAAAQQTAAATMQELMALVLEAKDLEETLESLQEAFKAQNGRYNRIKQYLLPKMMKEAQLGNCGLPDGSVKVKLEKYVSGGIPKDEHEKVFALEYLQELPNGGSLIKNSLSVDFSKGQDNAAKAVYSKVMEMIKEMEMDNEVELKEGVHSASLQAFVKQMLKGGAAFDPEKLGCSVGDVAKFEFFDADGKKKKARTKEI